MGAKVYELKFKDFSQARNFGLKKATNEWIVYIDSDERVTPSLREEIIKSTNNPINKYSPLGSSARIFYFGNHEWPYIEYWKEYSKKTNCNAGTEKCMKAPR